MILGGHPEAMCCFVSIGSSFLLSLLFRREMETPKEVWMYSRGKGLNIEVLCCYDDVGGQRMRKALQYDKQDILSLM